MSKNDDWDKRHLSNCHYVAIEEDNVVGWIAVSPTSSRPTYSGSVEVSIYVNDAYQGKWNWIYALSNKNGQLNHYNIRNHIISFQLQIYVLLYDINQ